MSKYFITYQPQSVVNILENTDYKPNKNYDLLYNNIEKVFGYKPIFLVPINNKLDFFVRNHYACPSKPDVMIITKLDVYDCINMFEWFNIRGGAKYNNIRINESSGIEAEYITNEILKQNFIKSIKVYDMIKDIPEYKQIRHSININNITKMLVYSPMFWNELDYYFNLYTDDCSDMLKFAKIVSDNKLTSNEDDFINFRKKIEKLYKDNRTKIW